MLILRLLGLFLALSLFVGCAGQNSPDLPDVLTARPETKTTEKTSPLIKNANNSQDDLQRHLSLTPLELCGRVSGAYVVSDEQREMALVELRSRNIFTEQELQKISKKTIAVGMREIAAFCAWGIPNKTNPANPDKGQMVEYFYESKSYPGQSFYTRNGRVVAKPVGKTEFQRIYPNKREEPDITTAQAAAAVVVVPGYVLICLATLGLGGC